MSAPLLIRHTPKIVILGAGLSAAYAARACIDRGILPKLLTRHILGRQGGAMYLRELPSSVRQFAKQYTIYELGIGTDKQYSRNMWEYGREHEFQRGLQFTMGYDPEECLPYLFGGLHYEPCSINSDEEVQELANIYDGVILTFPTFWSQEHHAYNQIREWILSWPRTGSWERHPVIRAYGEDLFRHRPSFDHWIVRVGLPSEIVRYSEIFGIQSVETVVEPDQEITPGVLVREVKMVHPETIPYELNGLFTDNVMITGRLARWDAKEYAHHSYYRTSVWLADRFG